MKFLKWIWKLFCGQLTTKKQEQPVKHKKPQKDNLVARTTRLDSTLNTFLQRMQETGLIKSKTSKDWKIFRDSFKSAVSFFRVKNIPLFFAQCCHESMNFAHSEENLNYSAERLLAVFPKYFKNLKECKKIAHNKVAIGDRVYGGRLGNGPQEGYLFRGRGYIQLTGRDNYQAFLLSVAKHKIPKNAHHLSVADLKKLHRGLKALLHGEESNRFEDIRFKEFFNWFSAAWFWSYNNIDSRANTVRKSTKIINGGYNGLQDRKCIFYDVTSAIFSITENSEFNLNNLDWKDYLL